MTNNIVLSDSIPNLIDSYLWGPPQTTMIGNAADGLDGPRDLDFHPELSRKELWVISKETESFGGTTVTYSNAGLSSQTSLYRKDGNSWHFMSLPTGLAFSDNGNWANSPGVFDANHNGGTPFTGPVLWSSDPAVYAQPSGGNGSHLDMLHASPYSMGIAFERDNVFWIFDSYNGDIVRYDFVDDHGPGNSYHLDAIIRRYPVPVSRINLEIPCHMVLDHETNWLYIVDGGSNQVIRLDITSGVPNGTPIAPAYEQIAEYTQMDQVTVETVVSTGLIEPSGIDVIDNRMIISDHSNGDILIYDISTVPATLLGTVPTGSAGIQGITIGPEGYIWYINKLSNQVFKMEHSATAVNEVNDLDDLVVFPNPSNGQFSISSSDLSKGNYTVIVENILGQQMKVLNIQELNESLINIDLSDLPAGVYGLSVENAKSRISTKNIVINR